MSRVRITVGSVLRWCQNNEHLTTSPEPSLSPWYSSQHYFYTEILSTIFQIPSVTPTGSVSSLTPGDQQSEVKTSTKGETQRVLTHYQFTGWPDFGAPLFPSPLLTLVRKVRSAVKAADGPILVHCRLADTYFHLVISLINNSLME